MSRSLLVLAALSAGCSEFDLIMSELPSDEPTAFDTAAPAEDEPAEDAPDEPTATEPPEGDCEETSDLVYVIDRAEEELYLFEPSTLTYTSLGALNCPSGSSTPASMAVSRDGRAFVRYSDNAIHAVDLATMDCNKTGYDADLGDFGMGFATDAAGGWQDTLYLAGDPDVVAADTSTWSLSATSTVPSYAELTGDANGELWAFLPLEVPAKLVQLDKAGGAPLTSLSLPDFPDAGDIDTFAFATWGGDFWLFVREYGMGRTTDVYRVQPDGTMSLVFEDSGRDIVGAGVSTCAPTE